MGKYMRKYKRIGEIAVMEVGHAGVRKRARAIAIAAEASSGNKRRKAAPRELRCSPSIFQLRSGGRVKVKPKDSVSPSTSRILVQRTVSNDRCSSDSSDNFPTSCCSSTASSDRAKQGFKVSDLEDDSVQIETSTCEYFGPRERREMTSSSEVQVESEANSRPRLSVEKMPSDPELEEFFAVAEKDLQKRFAEKYNYDIIKDVPLEGRYDWIRLKP
ncbi:hypothetical protein NMG60_11008122 [Bertholletia excelsa]